MPAGNHVCPVEGRRFSSAMALRQHKADAHPATGARARTRAPPTRRRRSGPVARPMSMEVVRTSGTDLLGTFNVTSGLQVGYLLAHYPLGPAHFPRSRIRVEASLYQRWRPVRMRIRFLGSGPATAGGALVLAWNPDPVDHLQNRSPGLNYAFNSQRSIGCRLDALSAFDVPVDSNLKWYQTDETGALGAHGSFISVLTSGPSGIRGTVAVTAVLDWTIDWSGRKLEVDANIEQSISPDQGYENLFTTSDSSFDASYLTFKAHSGGSMVPFSTALPGTVYTTEGTSTKVSYYEDASKLQDCKYFSLVVGYEIKGLVLHASFQNAREYQRTGSKTYCIGYHAAGPYVTPAKPIFRSVASELPNEPTPTPPPSDRPSPPDFEEIVRKASQASKDYSDAIYRSVAKQSNRNVSYIEAIFWAIDTLHPQTFRKIISDMKVEWPPSWRNPPLPPDKPPTKTDDSSTSHWELPIPSPSSLLLEDLELGEGPSSLDSGPLDFP